MKTNVQEVNALHAIDLYLYFYQDFIDENRTKKECDFIVKTCTLPPQSRILDLACGHGRHSVYLASQEHLLTGIDLSPAFIEYGREQAAKQNLNIDFQVGNMLEIDFQEQFDSLLLLFNSFGFLDKTDGLKLLQKMRAAIKPKGKIFVDIKNRDSILTEITDCQITEKGQDLMIDRLDFDPKSGTTTNRRIYIKDGQRYDTPFTMQLYNYSEFAAMVEQSGLQIVQTFGNWQGGPFDRTSRRLIALLGRKG